MIFIYNAEVVMTNVPAFESQNAAGSIIAKIFAKEADTACICYSPGDMRYSIADSGRAKDILGCELARNKRGFIELIRGSP